MSQLSIGYFALGMFGAPLTLLALWVRRGIHLDLYLLSRESAIDDQAMIPVTVTTRHRSRKESIDLTLMDYTGGEYVFLLAYHPVFRFSLVLKAAPHPVLLNGRVVQLDRVHLIRSGASLITGEREYEFRVTADKRFAHERRELDAA